MIRETQACPAYAVILISRRGDIRQLAAPDITTAMDMAREHAKTCLGVVVENERGNIVWEFG
jgi:hypothetical protein